MNTINGRQLLGPIRLGLLGVAGKLKSAWTLGFFITVLAALSLFADSGPSIRTQPEGQIVSPGSNFVFAVEAHGTAPLSFQWRKNGVPIPFANDDYYYLGGIQTDDLGLYSVVVTNSEGSTSSVEVALSFASATAFADDFESGNLDNWTVAPSCTALTNVSDFSRPEGVRTARLYTSLDKMHHRLEPNVDGRARLSCWMFDTNQPKAFAETRSFNGGVYGGTLAQLLAIGMYNSATMPNESHIGTNYQGRVLTATNAGWFSLNNTNAPRRSSFWHQFEIERPFDGTYADFYVDGIWSRRITGIVPSAWDYVTIGSVGPGGTTVGNAWFDDVKVVYYDPPIFITQPANQAAHSGDTITFIANASGSVMGYQWRCDGAALTGATNSTLTLTNVSVAQAGIYTAVAMNGVGATASANALLSLTELELPVITAHPTNVTVNLGSPAAFTVSATGAEPLTYAWLKIASNATNVVTNGGTISGADTPTLSFSSVSVSDAAIYRATVSNAATIVSSSNALLTVVTPPVITVQPQPITLLADQTGALSVTASGSALSYQWYFETQPVPGASESKLTLSNAQPVQAGNYSVIVSNSAGTTTSTPAAVAVHYYLSALGSGGDVLKQPTQLSYAPGSVVTLSAVPTPNYIFLNWSGDATGTNNPITVSMTGHKRISANFANVNPNGKVIRDGNIDPANLGKGDWIYFISAATNKLGGNVPSVTNENSLMLWYKKHGVRYIVVKAGDNQSLFNGSYSRPQFTNTFVDIAHLHGLSVFGYNRSFGQNIPAEISIADYVFNQGADGFVYDAEIEWELGNSWITNAPLQAWQLCGAVRTNWPNKFVACNTFAIISIHDNPFYAFPYRQFGYWTDAFIPMIYHYNWAGRSPSGAIDWTDVGWQAWQQTCAHPTNNPAIFLGAEVYWTNSIKPIAPVGHVYGPTPPNGGINELEPDDVAEWADYLTVDPNCPTPGGYKGFSFWRTDLHGAEQWTNIGIATGGDFAGQVNSIVVDDRQATRVGPWTHVRTFYNGYFYGNGSGADTNSFGTNYFTINQGTGSSSAQFNPNVTVGGDYDVYEWHVQRADASTNVPFEINFNGGSASVRVNQRTNAGKWCRLGRFNFATGTNGNIRISDDIPESGGIAIADAIKLVFVPSLVIPSQTVNMRSDGHLQFDFSTVPGAIVEIQSCENLTIGDWQPLATVTNVTGHATFVDPSSNAGKRFYRLRSAP